MPYRRSQRVFYTGQALTRGVVSAKVLHVATDLGTMRLKLDGDDVEITELLGSKYVFRSRMDAVRAAYHDVASADNGARSVVEAYTRKRDAYRGIMDDLFAELYPQTTISASARIT